MVTMTDRDVVKVFCKMRFQTMIELPKGEEILKIVIGDKDFWVIDGDHNFAFVKPSKALALSNMTLITSSGNAYPFTLEESDRKPDIKITVKLGGELLANASTD